MTLRVLVAGQRSFGAAVAEAVAGSYDLAGVIAPPGDRLSDAAERLGVPVRASASPLSLPAGLDVIVAAHSHAFIGRRTRSAARLAAIGYHPSLLPLHRGRDAVRWTVRNGDRVAGGSVYHLTDNVDAGPVAAQDWIFVPPGTTTAELWRALFPLGVRLVLQALGDLACGRTVAVPQDERCATWEPSWGRPPLHRPELPELTGRAPGLRWDANPALLRRGA